MYTSVHALFVLSRKKNMGYNEKEPLWKRGLKIEPIAAAMKQQIAFSFSQTNEPY